MPAYILKLFLKIINRDEPQLTELENDIMNRWSRNATSQELNYYSLLLDKVY